MIHGIRVTAFLVCLILQGISGEFAMDSACSPTRNQISSDSLDIDVKCFADQYSCSMLGQKFPRLYSSKSQLSVVEPELLSHTGYCALAQDGQNRTGLDIKWRLRQKDGVENTKGFELQLSLQGRDFRCIIIEFKENITTEMLMTSPPMFHARLFPIYSNVVFPTLESLPSGEGGKYLQVNMPKCKNPLPSSHWCPAKSSFEYQYDSYNKTLTIRFDPPPTGINITQFEISERVLDRSISLINGTQHMYYSVNPGNYSFKINPYNSFQKDAQRCACKNDNGRCITCAYCPNYVAIVTGPEPPMTSPTSTHDDVNNTKSALVISLSVLSAIVVLIFLVFLAFKRFGIHIDCSFFKLDKRAKGKIQRVFVLLETNGDSTCQQKTLDILDSNFGNAIDYQILQIHGNLSGGPSAFSAALSDGRKLNKILLEKRADVFVCLCMIIGKRCDDKKSVSFNNISSMEEIVLSLEGSYKANIKVRGIVVNWGSQSCGTDSETVHVFKLPKDETNLLTNISSFMQISCAKYATVFRCEAGPNDQTTKLGCFGKDSEQLVVDIGQIRQAKVKCRYASKNDSGFGDNMSTVSDKSDLGCAYDLDEPFLEPEYDTGYGRLACTNVRPNNMYTQRHESYPIRANPYAHTYLHMADTRDQNLMPVYREHAPLLQRDDAVYREHPPVFVKDCNYQNQRPNFDGICCQSKPELTQDDISFLPPTPSVLSLNDQTDDLSHNGRDEHGGNDGVNPGKHAEKLQTDDDMDSIMEQFVAINKRNNSLTVGDVRTVFEGRV